MAKTDYMLKIRLNEFMKQLLRYYSVKTNRTMQDITVASLDEYLRSRLSKEEYHDIFVHVKEQDRILVKAEYEINEGFQQYYDSLDAEGKQELDGIYEQVQKIIEKPDGKIQFSDIKGYNDLPKLVQDRLRLQAIMEYDESRGRENTGVVDMDGLADAEKRLKELKKRDKRKTS